MKKKIVLYDDYPFLSTDVSTPMIGRDEELVEIKISGKKKRPTKKFYYDPKNHHKMYKIIVNIDVHEVDAKGKRI